MPSNVLVLNKYPCPVCGFMLDYPAADFNICPSCGVEFGADTVEYTYSELREAWINRGMTWTNFGIPRPADYNPINQLKSLTALNVIADSSVSRGQIGSPDQTVPRIQPMSSTTAGLLRLQRA